MISDSDKLRIIRLILDDKELDASIEIPKAIRSYFVANAPKPNAEEIDLTLNQYKPYNACHAYKARVGCTLKEAYWVIEDLKLSIA